MPLSLATLSLVASPLPVPEGLKILERDDYRCQYCGLDGRASFENALVMGVDFVFRAPAKERKIPATWSRVVRPATPIQNRAPDFQGSKRVSVLPAAREPRLAP